MYTGANDLSLSTFQKGLDFGTSHRLGVNLKFRIINADDEDQMVILNPSHTPSNPLRVIRTGVIPYTGGATNLTATVNINTIEEALAYIAANPTEVLFIRVTSTNELQFTQSFKTIKRKFGQPPVEKIYNLEQSRFQTNSKIVYLSEEIQLDADTELQFIVPGYIAEGTPTDTTLQFSYGASISNAAEFENKKALAMQSPEVRQLKAAFNPEK